MSYHRSRTRQALGADMAHGPRWYTAMGSITSQPPPPGVRTYRPTQMMLGSLGDDPAGTTTLSGPTVTDPTAVWQANVLAQLQAGVNTMKTSELQKWLQIAATLAIPVSAAIWKAIFRSGGRMSDTGV